MKETRRKGERVVRLEICTGIKHEREKKEGAGCEQERRKGEMKESYVLDEGGCLFYFW